MLTARLSPSSLHHLAARATVFLAVAAVGCTDRAEPDAGSSAASSADCSVAAIGDGDSLTCHDGRRMRLLLIDTPELAQPPYGAIARDALVALAPIGTVLTVEYDVERLDQHGRDLTYLYLTDGTMINEELVARGFAVTLVYAPNGKHLDRMNAALAAAQESRRGFWADWAFACLPRDFRRGRCR